MGTLLVLLPLVGVVLLNLPYLGKFPNRAALWLAFGFCFLEAVLVLLGSGAFWNQPTLLGINMQEAFSTSFPVDNLARVMFLATAIVGLCTVLVGRYTLANNETRFRFANLLLLSLAGLNGLVLVHDLLGLYVFLEITGVSSFVLIALERGRAAFEGAFKYMVLSAVATAMFVGGLALLFMVAGSTSFEVVKSALQGARGNQDLVVVAIALFIGGLSIKAGLVPFHGWLPDAYSSAPAAVSVLLAGIVTKTTGVYTLIRLVDAVFGYSPPVQKVLLAAGLASILIGALGALGQKDFKRMLAYSSISQVGYIILGLGAGSAIGLAGAIFHLFNHAIFKSLLFVNSAAVEQQSGTRNMNELGGISVKMPVTSATSVLAILSTAGIPPLAGFWSKLLVIVAVWKAGFEVFAAVAIVASILTLAYFLSMQSRVFFGKLSEKCVGLKEANAWALVPALLLAAITVGLGVGAPWLFETFLLPIRSIL